LIVAPAATVTVMPGSMVTFPEIVTVSIQVVFDVM